jgi:hypothetical protein
MGNKKGRQVRARTSNREAEVKPWGPGAKADLSIASERTERPMFGEDLMEVIGARDNLRVALKRVRQNQGSPAVDGMTVEELPGYLKEHWLAIKELLLKGEYTPRPVKRVEIPKPGRPRRSASWVSRVSSIGLSSRRSCRYSSLAGTRASPNTTPSVLRDLDSWVRRRLRCVQWKQWKVYQRRKAELMRLGVDAELAHTTAWSPRDWSFCFTH